jgi:hypothetical protein
VEADGTISDAKVVSVVEGAPGFSKEAMRLITAMPQWNPGITNGVKSRKWVVVSVEFKL